LTNKLRNSNPFVSDLGWVKTATATRFAGSCEIRLSAVKADNVFASLPAAGGRRKRKQRGGIPNYLAAAAAASVPARG